MAFRPNLPNASLKRIAVRVGPYLSTAEAGSEKGRWEAAHGRANPTLGPAFEIWVLGLNAIHALKRPDVAALARFRVAEIAENSRSWHIEIRRDKASAVGFAEATDISAEGEDETWVVHRMGLLPAAAREFQRGLDRIEKLASESKRKPRVRVLHAPGLHIGLFWLQNARDDQVLVFHRPSGKTRISPNRLYDWPEFVEILAHNVNSLYIGGPRIAAAFNAQQKGAAAAG